jgi:dipeptidyl aminopeptidase/acylaminoacyl peptidase
MHRALLLVLLLPSLAVAQGTADDYKRALGLRDKYADAVPHLTVQANWLGGGRFWFRDDLGGGKKAFLLVEAEKATKEPAFDHAKLAELLAKETGRKVDAEKLPFDDIRLDGGVVTFTSAEKTWKYDAEKHTLTEERRAASPPPPPRFGPRRGRPPAEENSTRSPDGKFAAFVRNFNVWLRETGGDRKEFPLSFEGTADDGYTSVYWSPDSKKLVAMRRTKGGDRVVTYVESSPRDQLQPKTTTVPYLKPGDPIPQPKPHLFDVTARKEIPVSDALFPNPWDISYEHWTPDGKRFLFLYNQRGHTVLRVVAIDAETGKATAIVYEECKTFFDYAGKLYLNYLDKTNELIWMSERNGWNHLHLIDAATGGVKNAITSGEWNVRGVDRVDAEKREIVFRMVGHDAKEDPYHVHAARINFDGSGFKKLTDGDGTHAVQWSPNGKFFLDSWSRVDSPPVHVLRKADGSKVLQVAAADATELKNRGWQPPERFVAKGRDGTTDIHGLILRPSNFDPKKRYPVIEYIYAGPHDHHVPKRFQPHFRRQEMAELGFIVVQCDGMGTSWRSKAFHDVCWKNLGDGGFPDRIAWIKAAAAKFPEMDIAKGVGIYGGSAGGQNTLCGMLAHPEFYTVGVADCGCHDNRMDKVWWNELWMGWPVGPHYVEQSNTTNAHKLKGKLMLVVGEMDTNVDPASTMQVVNALEKADKDFDLVVMTGTNHGAAESPYANRRRMDFFVRHLLGVEPRR